MRSDPVVAAAIAKAEERMKSLQTAIDALHAEIEIERATLTALVRDEEAATEAVQAAEAAMAAEFASDLDWGKASA